jgi:NADH-quinone oxidoreductase subunit L
VSNLPVSDQSQSGFTKLVANKFYVDEIYHALFIKPTEKLSKFLYQYADIQGVDGAVNGVGAGVSKLGSIFRRLQNGNIEYYLIGMVVGAVLLFLTMFI